MAKEEIEEIIVHTQEELEAIPEDFEGLVVLLDFEGVVNQYRVRFGKIRAISSAVNIYNGSIVAVDCTVNAYRASRVEAYGMSCVSANGHSRVEAYGKTTVVAKESSYSVLHDKANAIAMEHATISALDTSYVSAKAYSKIYANGCSTVKAYDHAKISASGDSRVWINNIAEARAYDRAQVVCGGYNIVNAFGRSTIIVSGFPKRITANGFATVWCSAEQLSSRGLITLRQNARTVLHPRNIETEDGTGLFYKAVHKLENGAYVSDFNRNFIYKIGSKVTSKCEPDTNIECGEGIHIANLDWAYNYGIGWLDMAILELKVDLDKVVVPVTGCGKARTPEATVVREVDINEVLCFK